MGGGINYQHQSVVDVEKIGNDDRSRPLQFIKTHTGTPEIVLWEVVNVSVSGSQS